MKKLAIMFVMLLGSVATIQAQTFDFSCFSTETTPWEQTFVPAGITQEQADVLFDIDLWAFQTNPGFPYFEASYLIGDSYIIVERVFDRIDDSYSYSVYDEQLGDDFEAREGLTFEEATAYVSSLLPPAIVGLESNQVQALLNDGLIFGTYDVNGANPARTVTGLQGMFVSDNPIIGAVEFVVASSPNGAERDLHDANGNVIGRGSFNYSITGHNVTPEYFATADAAAGRAMVLNTRN